MFKDEIAQNNGRHSLIELSHNLLLAYLVRVSGVIRRTRLHFTYLPKRNARTPGKSRTRAFYIVFLFFFLKTETFDLERKKRMTQDGVVLTCNFMAWKLVDSFEGGVFLRRARGHQNNFIVGHVKGAFRRRGCDLARATSILHLVGRPAGRHRAL